MKTEDSGLKLRVNILRKTNNQKTAATALIATLKNVACSDFISVSPKETPAIHPIIKG
jgi:hypothetical protein